MKLSSLKESRPHEYILRFVFGGVCTVIAGLVAKKFGPGAGGLFLAFPAIFPASASLIESHEKRRKREAGMDGTARGREAASLDAAGAAMGAIGLIAFAAVVWTALSDYGSVGVISGAVATWLSVSVGLWILQRHRLWKHRRPSRAE